MLKTLIVTAIDQLESMSQSNQYEGSAQLLQVRRFGRPTCTFINEICYTQAVVQLMQHFKSYKCVPQIALLSERITGLQMSLERKILTTFEQGYISCATSSMDYH